MNVNQVCTLLSPLKGIFLGKFTSHAPANLKKTKMKQSKKQKKTMQHSKASFEGLFVHVFLDLPVNLPYSFFVAVFSLVRLGTELSTPHVLRRHSPIGLHSLPLIPFHHVAESSNSYAEIELSQDLACSEHVGLHLRPQSSGIRTKLCYRVSVCARKGVGTQTPSFLRNTERNKDRCSCLQVPPQTCYSLGGWLSLSRSLLLRSAPIEIKPHP